MPNTVPEIIELSTNYQNQILHIHTSLDNMTTMESTLRLQQ